MPVTRNSNCSVPHVSPVYLQACSVCKGEFCGLNDWLDHLVKKEHQKLAREDCLKIWDSDSRKSCLVIFTSESLTNQNAMGILDHFSSPTGKQNFATMVTDFIWWEDRPKIGIMQFESKEKAEHVLRTFGYRRSSQIQISDSLRIQVKPGIKMEELEWSAIMPQMESNAIVDPPNKKRKLDANQTYQEMDPSNQSHIVEESPPLPITNSSDSLQIQYQTIIENTTPVPQACQTKNQMEVEISRLLECLCQFDPRCKPLISLTTYWLTINSIDISGNCNSKDSMELPSHFTVSWLVMSFLCYKAHVPTPRQIFKTSNKKSPSISTETSIDFQCDPKYVEEWKLRKDSSLNLMDNLSEEFILNLLKLFWDFLNHCVGTFGGNEKENVMNTRDGKIISVDALLQCSSSGLYKSKRSFKWRNLMSRSEIFVLKTAVVKAKSSKEFSGLHMTNPFLLSECFPIAKDFKISLKHFSTGHAKVLAFLSQVERIGLEASLAKVGSLKSLLTIKKQM